MYTFNTMKRWKHQHYSANIKKSNFLYIFLKCLWNFGIQPPLSVLRILQTFTLHIRKRTPLFQKEMNWTLMKNEACFVIQLAETKKNRILQYEGVTIRQKRKREILQLDNWILRRVSPKATSFLSKFIASTLMHKHVYR